MDGNRFCFDIKKINSNTYEAQTSSMSVTSTPSCTLKLPNNREVSLSRCEGRFNYDGNDIWRIHLRATIKTTYDLVANYDFRNGTFEGSYSSSSSSSSSYYNYTPEFYSVSTTRPNRDQWVDVTLRVRRDGSSYNYYYDWRVDFSVEKYSWGSWYKASSYEYELDRTSYSFSSSDYGEKRLNSLVRFRESWEYRLVAELRDSNWAMVYQTFNVDGYYSDSSSYYSSSSYDAKELSIDSISTTSPRTYEWINVTVKAIASNWSVASNYNKRIKFEVEEYRNGSWKTASYSDYELSTESYYFSTSDSGRRTFNSLIRFKTSGEYRLKVSEQYNSSIYGTKTIYVDTSSSSNYYNSYNNSVSSSYDARELSFYSISTTSPRTYEWINVTVRAIANDWSIAGNYNKRIRFEVDEYRNGSWRTASSSDYDLERTTYSFSTSDNWRKTFNSLIRFRTSGQYRLKVYQENNSSVYGTETFYVDISSSSSYYNSYNNSYYYSNSSYGFTDNELKKVRGVYNIWNNVISALEKDYPNLRNNSSWRSRSDTFYNNMRDVLNDSRSASFRNWNDFYNAFMDWFSYTTKVR